MFSFRNSLTIDHTLVGGSDLTDFPVLVSLTHVDFKSVANDGDVQSANGFDIVFYADTSQSVQLDHEIEKYDPATGQIIMWVRLPSVSHTVDTVFSVFYGDASITTSQENVAGVWDANYKGVWHLKEDPTGGAPQYLDSSGNGNHLTANSGPTRDLSSQIGAGMSLDGTASASVAQNASLNGHSTITLQAWIKPTTFGTGDLGRIFDKTQSGATGFHLAVTATQENLRFTRTGTNGQWDSAISSIVSGGATWASVAITYDYGNTANDPIFYKDGSVLSSERTSAPSSTTPNDSSNDLYIGDNSGAIRGFNGDIDEARFSNVIRSPDWILAEYNNQFTPTDFITLGSQVPVTVATTGPSLFRGRSFPFFDDDQVNRFEFWPGIAAGATDLVIQNASHAHAAGSLALTQAHALAIQSSSLSHSVENLVLSGSGDLEIQNSTHAHSVESLVLTQSHSLTVQSASHAHTAANITLGGVGPIISNIVSTPALAASARIRWTTNAPATARVFYDTVSRPADTDGSQYAFSTAVDSSADVSNHFRQLTYLTPDTTYFYKLRSSNGDGTTFSAELSLTTAENAVRVSNLLIIRMNFPNDLTSLPSDATINTQMGAVASGMEEQSFGQSEVTWDIVPGTFTAPEDTDFYKNLETTVSSARRAEQLALDASAWALGESFDTSDYFQYVIWVPQQYDWANAAYFTGVNGFSQLHLGIFVANYLVWANLATSGLGAANRANAWITNDSTVFGSAGAPDPGGIADPYEALGSSEDQTIPLNIRHKIGTGFLLPHHIQTVEFNGTYRIYSHVTTTTLDETRKYGLRMEGYQGTDYWIEFREVDPTNGVIVNWGGLMFLDLEPGSPLTDGYLPIGETFTDPDGRAITFTSTGGSTPTFVDITIAGLADAPELTIQAATHTHTADNLTLTQVHTLAIQNASHGHTSENVALTQVHALAVQESSHAHTSENLTLTQAHSLAINDATHAHTADNTVLAQVHQLAVNSASHTHSADSLVLSQVHALTVDPATHDHTSENVVLGVAGDLQIANASHAHTAESLVLTQTHSLEVANSSHSHTAQNLELTGTGDLVVQSATHEHSAESLVLTQVHDLVVANSSHDHVGGSLALTQEHSLAVQDASHEHVVESLALTQTHQLAIADAAHGHGAESPTLTQAHSLTIQSSSHAQTAENLVLAAEGTLGIQNGSHGHTSQSLSLTQAHQLVIASGAHGHSAESLTIAVIHDLEIQPSAHAHSSATPDLTQVHSLVVQSASHAHSADNVEVSSEGTLGIQSAGHSHTAQGMVLTQAHSLITANTSHGHTAENISLTEVYNLNIQSAVHSHTAENLGLSQVYDLVIADSAHGHVAQNLTLGNQEHLLIANSFHAHTARNISFAWTLPADVYEVEAESRVFVVPEEERIFQV